MKRLRLLFVALIVACTLWLPAQAATAAPADEAALDKVDAAVSELWDFVEANETVRDEVFYPAFVELAQEAQSVITDAKSQLERTTETGDTKKAIELLIEDIDQIQVALIAWRESAVAQDTPTFEESSYLLQEIINIYNDDIGAYNTAAHGTDYAIELLSHLGLLFTAFALSGLLFARAVYYNGETEDVLQEIKRKLRWHWLYASLAVTAVSLIPAYVYLFTEYTMPWWGWLLLLLGLIPLVYVLVRTIQVRRLAKRHG